MKENKTPCSSYKFHSITNLYKGSSEEDLNLQIYEYGTDAVEVKLINTNYNNQYRSLRMQFIYLNLCFIAYGMILLYKTVHLLNIVFILWFTTLLWHLNKLVEFEKFIFCHDFGIHLQAQTFWGKHNRFVAASNIHDIVINEVLEDLDFRYLLILRTKGRLFKKKPIICIFQMFKPCRKCLWLIYEHLSKVTVKTKTV